MSANIMSFLFCFYSIIPCTS